MLPAQFRCFYVTKDDQGRAQGRVEQRPSSELPQGDVLIRVQASSLNYKDGLSATGNPGVTRNYPHVPGIDAAGAVVASGHPQFKEGDSVLVTGFDLGANTWGGYAELVRVPAAWVVPLPSGLSLEESMIYGTAGFTVALALERFEQLGVTPERGEVLVTGATGGVGSLAVAMLSKVGYEVVASTGKADAAEYLEALGARRVIARREVDDRSERPLLRGAWAAAIDTVGSNTLATVLRSLQRGGCVASTGLVGGAEFSITVMPFILRGVTLTGIDSAEYPAPRRPNVWQRMAGPWKPAMLREIVAARTGLDGLPQHIAKIMSGGVRGRVLVEPCK
jgi:putative YhdH/YhfP family quinone oxidoreductase